MESFTKMVDYFRKKRHLRGGLYGGEYQSGLKFQLVKPSDEISLDMLSDNNVKTEPKFHHDLNEPN